MTISGGTAILTSNLILSVGNGVGGESVGTLWQTGGELVVTNAATILGDAQLSQGGIAFMTMSNGTARLREVLLAKSSSADATWTIVNGTNLLSSAMTIGDQGNGTLSIAGGMLVATNGSGIIGSNGFGTAFIGNGFASLTNVTVGFSAGSNGKLTVNGAARSRFAGFFSLASATSWNTGSVWLSGGQLVATNGITTIGNNGFASVTVSNGTMLGTAISVAAGSPSRGILTLNGGTVTPSSFLSLGVNSSTATGQLWMTGGQLITPSVVVGNLGIGADGGLGWDSAGCDTTRDGQLPPIGNGTVVPGGGRTARDQRRLQRHTGRPPRHVTTGWMAGWRVSIGWWQPTARTFFS